MRVLISSCVSGASTADPHPPVLSGARHTRVWHGLWGRGVGQPTCCQRRGTAHQPPVWGNDGPLGKGNVRVITLNSSLSPFPSSVFYGFFFFFFVFLILFLFFFFVIVLNLLILLLFPILFLLLILSHFLSCTLSFSSSSYNVLISPCGVGYTKKKFSSILVWSGNFSASNVLPRYISNRSP